MWRTAPLWHWLAMMVLWVVVVATALWATARLFPSDAHRRSARGRRSSAVRRLDGRLAHGEIGVEEYRRLRDELEATVSRERVGG